MVVGERTLGEKMKCISKEAELSKIYSNHSIRATAVTILDKCGYDARHIMAVSGHKSVSSIRSYFKTDTSTKKQMSESMAAATSTVALSESNRCRYRLYLCHKKSFLCVMFLWVPLLLRFLKRTIFLIVTSFSAIKTSRTETFN